MERPVALPPAQILVTGTGGPLGVAIWARRAISISVFGVAAIVLVTTAPGWMPLSLLIDAVRRKRLTTTRALLFLTLFFCCEMIGVAVAAWLWLRHFRGDRARFSAANFALQRWWTRTLQRGAFKLFSLTLSVEGAEVCAPGPLIAMFRHCSVADTLLPMMLIAIPHDIELRWVLKSELLWDPCMDIVGNRLKNCFVSRMPETNARDVAAVGTLMENLGDRDGVAIYPEGTRFSSAKRQRLVDKLGEQATVFENVLPPRLGGALALLDNNTAEADVVFCAHTGFESIASLGDLFSGRLVGNTIAVRLWRVPYDKMPTTREERIAWLLSEWKKVDRMSVSRP